MSEASNNTSSSDSAANQSSAAARASRPPKKLHNFGKRSNSIRKNPSAPVIKRNWLYKQDSSGMKLWKKRWFVLSDLCLFYYRDEKEEGILGSILLPSFHVSMLSVDDHITRKYAFKATHPNMRTYYFCTDTAKEMESWMKVMTDAALLHSDPVKRLDKLKVEQCGPQEVNQMDNHRPPLTQPEIENNERNREADREHIAEEDKKRRDAERYGFQKEGANPDRPLTKINSIKMQPAQTAAAVTVKLAMPRTPTEIDGSHQTPQVNGGGEPGPVDHAGVPPQQSSNYEPERTLSRTSSMQQLEQWVRTQRGRTQDDDTRSITSYQTLPRNMPNHRMPHVPHYGDGYRSMPRNSMTQRDSICSMSPSLYDQPSGLPMADKRRSVRSDTMWQLYEWQQRQGHTRAPPMYGHMASPKTMINLSEHAAPTYSIPPSPSHGSLSMYGGYSQPPRSYNMSSARSEMASPIYQRDLSMERQQRHQIPMYAYPPDRRSMPVGIPVQAITAQSLQGKSLNPEDPREHSYMPEEGDIDTKLSRLCEQDKVVRTHEDNLQQLYREKHTLETALLSASHEIELGSDNPAAMQSVIQQRDLLQSGLLGTCRELSRVTTELERSWREYDQLEGAVILTKSNLLEQLEALGSPQTEPPSQHHVHIQKELWRIQDVMEVLNKHKDQRNADGSMALYGPNFSMQKTEGPDYRLYKSEPELTTVAEVDESNGEDRIEHPSDHPANKGPSYPVGIVPPRTKSPVPDSSSIASYVTLRKSKKPDSRMERPHSAMEHQLCALESSRPRMSVEEQLERIRRHQQGALKEKKKGVRIRGNAEENALSRSNSFTKDNHSRNVQSQMRRRDDVMSTDILELEASLRQQEVVREQETPAEEIARLKEASNSERFNVVRQLSVPDKVLIPERYVESDPEEALSPEQEADKQRKVDRIKALIAKNSMQNPMPTIALSPVEAEEEITIQEKEKMINISYKLAAEASKRSKLVAVKSPPPSSPTLPPSPNTPPQLADGSHFITSSGLSQNIHMKEITVDTATCFSEI
ncbi:pleckstrin homology domain-containing family A member 5-like isoform X4 [Syngnathus typhle]|nr:pleckstrin homology domain-containing family A member 5-like isoform X4 [Syngnathus typhle]XP_061138079.1 pleckstrin homology domain-containing family A member 5-like isoform X4 [Syngnathus typhle]